MEIDYEANFEDVVEDFQTFQEAYGLDDYDSDDEIKEIIL